MQTQTNDTSKIPGPSGTLLVETNSLTSDRAVGTAYKFKPKPLIPAKSPVPAEPYPG